MADPAVKLTRAQKRVLSLVETQGLHRYFDVWAGYWWTQGARKANARIVGLLMDLGLITFGENVHVFSGRQRSAAEITPAGRALLDALKDEGEASHGAS